MFNLKNGKYPKLVRKFQRLSPIIYGVLLIVDKFLVISPLLIWTGNVTRKNSTDESLNFTDFWGHTNRRR